jgi:hypothetical protein
MFTQKPLGLCQRKLKGELMARNYIMAAIIAVMTIGSIQRCSQEQIKLNTTGNEVGIADDQVCDYLITDELVTCSQGEISMKVVAVDQHAGTRRKNPSSGKYVGMYVKKPSEGMPGAGIVTYVYTAE